MATKIPFWVQERLVLFTPDKEIYFAQSDQNKRVLISTSKGTFETMLTLKELEDKLIPYNFLRTHKCYIVNMNKINEIISVTPVKSNACKNFAPFIATTVVIFALLNQATNCAAAKAVTIKLKDPANP